MAARGMGISKICPLHVLQSGCRAAAQEEYLVADKRMNARTRLQQISREIKATFFATECLIKG